MKDLRRGKFLINMDLIDKYPEIVRKIMSKVIVIRAECLYGETIEYVAISTEFDKLKHGNLIPKYNSIINRGTGEVSFARIK